MLITDYSSCMFDYMSTNKPCILFIPDYDEYISSRGLIMSLSNLPFAIAKSNEDLISSIILFSEEDYRYCLTNYLNQYNHYDNGLASSKVVSWINNKYS